MFILRHQSIHLRNTKSSFEHAFFPQLQFRLTTHSYFNHPTFKYFCKYSTHPILLNPTPQCFNMDMRVAIKFSEVSTLHDGVKKKIHKF